MEKEGNILDWIVYVFYGFISGLGEILPVSSGAHDYYFDLMSYFDPQQPLLKLCIHAAVLGALVLFGRHRIAQVYREMRIASQPPRLRKRQPEIMAVLDGKVTLSMLIPATFCVLLSNVLYTQVASLTLVVVLLILSGAIIYVPHFLRQGNKDSRHLSRMEALRFGFFGGLSALPGFSRTGALLSAGTIAGCSRKYMLDIVLLFLVPLGAVSVMMDILMLIFTGVAITGTMLLYGFLAAVAAFGGASLAIAALRYLSVNKGYILFSYYNWGLAIFGFILYLMI